MWKVSIKRNGAVIAGEEGYGRPSSVFTEEIGDAVRAMVEEFDGDPQSLEITVEAT